MTANEGPDVMVLVLRGPIANADVPTLCERVRALMDASAVAFVDCDVEAFADPDAGTIDALARLQLTARRLGRRVRLLNACAELEELLIFMGLDDTLPCAAASGLESRGQAEEREQALRVEEEADPGDPTA